MSDTDYYNDMWQKQGGYLQNDSEIKKKIQLIEEMFPSDIQTVLDVGCGDGAITNALASSWRITAIDLSEQAVKHLVSDVHGYVGSSSALPFGDEDFDLVFTSELLEHLKSPVLSKTIAELKRVSRNYVFISVPNDEKLRRRYTKCLNCLSEYHLYLHYHSFDIQKIKEMFPEYEVLKRVECGVMEPPSSNTISYVKNKIGRMYAYVDSVDLICPSCGATLVKKPRNLFQRAFNLALIISQKALFLALRQKPKPDWLMVLLKKKEI